MNGGKEKFEFYFLFFSPPVIHRICNKILHCLILRLMLISKIIPLWKIRSNIIDYVGHMVDKNYSLFPLDWISPCARGECSLDRDKRMFFSSIEYLKSYHILCFFLACAMGFLYSYFILSETSNEFFFLGSWLYFLALSILSLLICFMLSLFARILHLTG